MPYTRITNVPSGFKVRYVDPNIMSGLLAMEEAALIDNDLSEKLYDQFRRGSKAFKAHLTTGYAPDTKVPTHMLFVSWMGAKFMFRDDLSHRLSTEKET